MNEREQFMTGTHHHLRVGPKTKRGEMIEPGVYESVLVGWIIQVGYRCGYGTSYTKSIDDVVYGKKVEATRRKKELASINNPWILGLEVCKGDDQDE